MGKTIVLTPYRAFFEGAKNTIVDEKARIFSKFLGDQVVKITFPEFPLPITISTEFEPKRNFQFQVSGSARITFFVPLIPVKGFLLGGFKGRL